MRRPQQCARNCWSCMVAYARWNWEPWWQHGDVAASCRVHKGCGRGKRRAGCPVGKYGWRHTPGCHQRVEQLGQMIRSASILELRRCCMEAREWDDRSPQGHSRQEWLQHNTRQPMEPVRRLERYRMPAIRTGTSRSMFFRNKCIATIYRVILLIIMVNYNASIAN